MSEKKPENRNHLRRFVSFVLLFGFVVLLISGIVLFFSPRGWVARSTGWTFGGLGKWQWKVVHINLAWTIVVATVFHLMFNWRIFIGYFRRATPRGRAWARDLALAGALVLLLAAGAAWGLQPFNFLSGNEISRGRSWKGRNMDHNQGWGRGRGMGSGRGMGRGQGWGRGQGMGRGLGMGRGGRWP